VIKTLEITKDNIIDHNKLNKHEAIHFIEFLEEEKQRHKLAVIMCDANRYAFRNIPVLALAYQTSMQRHLKDIQFTQSTINLLRNKFGIKEKDGGF